MSYALRFLVCLCVVSLLAAGACAVCPALLAEAGLDVWDWPAAGGQLVAEEQRQHDLDQSLEGITRRHAERNRLGRELIAGRLSLAEAVRRTANLGGEPENFRKHLAVVYPGGSHEERLHWYVIDWTCDLVKDAGQAGVLRARLEQEMAARPPQTDGR